MLVLMGLLKLGTLIRFVPYTMTKCICMKTRMTSGSSWRQRLSTSGAPSPSS
ncbi:hypothetical protein [Senegalimassilia anaerobia]